MAGEPAEDAMAEKGPTVVYVAADELREALES
jgi:hypothetical protein